MIEITVACFYPHSDTYGAPTAPLVQEQASSGPTYDPAWYPEPQTQPQFPRM